MNYATVQDMIDRYGEPEMIQLTDPDIVAVQAPKAHPQWSAAEPVTALPSVPTLT